MTPEDQPPAKIRRLVVVGLVLVGLAGVWFAVGKLGLMPDVSDEGAVRRWVEEKGALGPILVIVVEALAVVLAPVPSAPIAVAAGAVFGPLWGTVYTVAGAELGSIAAFLIARTLGRDTVRRLVPKGGFFERLEKGESQGWLMAVVFASRLVPFLSFDAVSYAAGLTPLAFWRFAVATLAGVVPVAFALNYAGAELIASNPWIAAALLIVLAATSAAPFVVGAFRRRRGSLPDDHPDRVDDARDVAEDRQEDVQPEVQADAHLQEHAERRQQDGDEDAKDVHQKTPVGSPGQRGRRSVRSHP